MQTEENVLPALWWLTLSHGHLCEAWCWHPNRIDEQYQAVAEAPDSSAPRNKYLPEHNDPRRKQVMYCVKPNPEPKLRMLHKVMHTLMYAPCTSKVELKKRKKEEEEKT